MLNGGGMFTKWGHSALGFQIIESVHMTKTPILKRTVVRHNGTKAKKCYRLTWMTVPMNDVILDKTRNVIYCHPTIANELKRLFGDTSAKEVKRWK
jgi:hypothetical protein